MEKEYDTYQVSKNLIRLTKKVYLITFISGLIALGISLLAEYFTVLIVLFIYMASAAIFNFIMFVNNLQYICYYKENRNTLILRSLLLLINIPTAILIYIIIESFTTI
ncbi:hypothetical protein [Flavobacterium alkalisoli]|uniref:hypothetical protein n=1 Tax=Flavobacterium alkalisoli TaxID=2602769 RepID=UPI003A907E02